MQEIVMTSANRCARAGLVVLALVVGTAACGSPRPLAIPGRDGGPRQTGASRTGRNPRDVRMDAKRVAGKEPPATLIAEDGTRCVVTEGRYRETEIGDEAWCVWRVQ